MNNNEKEGRFSDYQEAMPSPLPSEPRSLRKCYIKDPSGKNLLCLFHCFGVTYQRILDDDLHQIVQITMAVLEDYRSGEIYTVLPEAVRFHRTKGLGG